MTPDNFDNQFEGVPRKIDTKVKGPKTLKPRGLVPEEEALPGYDISGEIVDGVFVLRYRANGKPRRI